MNTEVSVAVYSDSIYKYHPGLVDGVQFELFCRRGARIGGIRQLLGDTRSDSVDAVVLHVGTNELTHITDNIRRLPATLEQHKLLIRQAKEAYPGVPVVVSAILPRYDW